MDNAFIDWLWISSKRCKSGEIRQAKKDNRYWANCEGFGFVLVSPDDDRLYRWVNSWAECKVCSHRWVAVVPEGTSTELECAQCGKMAGVLEHG